MSQRLQLRDAQFRFPGPPVSEMGRQGQQTTDRAPGYAVGRSAGAKHRQDSTNGWADVCGSRGNRQEQPGTTDGLDIHEADLRP